MSTVEIQLTQGKVALIDEEDLPIVGGLKWNVSQGGSTTTMYAVRSRKGKGTVFLHRMLLGLTDPNIKVDHRDGDGLNNRRSNLRIATPQQNSRNVRKRRGTSSRFKGVSRRFDNGRKEWQAGTGIKGRRVHLGYFASEEEAAMAYDRFAISHYGEFANLNFPKGD